jgi:hypothetical protein
VANVVVQFRGVAGKLPGFPGTVRERVVARRAVQAALDGR